MALARLDTEFIKDTTSFHSVCKQVFGFPGFYGMNMDAWIDCMSYLRDEEAGMSRYCLAQEEMLLIEINDTEAFKARLPNVFDDLVECSAIVNKRYTDDGELAALALVFL